MTSDTDVLIQQQCLRTLAPAAPPAHLPGEARLGKDGHLPGEARLQLHVIPHLCPKFSLGPKKSIRAEFWTKIVYTVQKRRRLKHTILVLVSKCGGSQSLKGGSCLSEGQRDEQGLV